ncbi:TetR family transcriptional regulator [Rhodococcus sp. AW25M09]|uniref:TetR/AcrR family transcriptional regulator n=1 Tax=Rhodococcus sp. AW25M09 TaxID=1268303 RepID=UPI0002AC64B7|nr:TetR/AcrR family transcriptional regulator [Rhodococcus sp. AW25M09]CCQ13522.1 TetR family transcriptional regulator [Rhodococcus sp. AW25M09]
MSERKYAGRSPQERSSERIVRLMDTAVTLFGTHGYAATTIGMLCSGSNVSTRHFYREIGSRSELLKKIVTTMNEEGERAAREALTDDGRQSASASIETAIRAYLAVTCRTRMAARVCYVEVVGVSTDIELWRIHQREVIVEMFGALAEAAAARGELPGRNYRLVVLAIIGAANIFAQEWALSDSTDSTFTPYVDTLVELTKAALAAVTDRPTTEPAST